MQTAPSAPATLPPGGSYARSSTWLCRRHDKSKVQSPRSKVDLGLWTLLERMERMKSERNYSSHLLLLVAMLVAGSLGIATWTWAGGVVRAQQAMSSLSEAKEAPLRASPHPSSPADGVEPLPPGAS